MPTTMVDLIDARPIVIVPVGSWEQHGPHLPFDTDTVIAAELVRRVVASLTSIALFPVPPVAFSSSGEHADFAGTISIGGDTTSRVLVEIVRSCDWADGVVFVNGHGGNAGAIRDALNVVTAEGRRATSWSPTSSDPTDTHAGHDETSVMLLLDPSRVRMDRAAKGSEAALGTIIETLRSDGIRAVSENGILGDPTRANAIHGVSLLESWADSLKNHIENWCRGRS